MASKKSKTSKISKKINLALQGGGAHGAFTWGVLDRILEDGRLEIEAISGTSAGAMNAVALADGLMENGREGARERLATFWRAIGDLVGPLPWLRDPFAIARGDWNLESSPTYLALDLAKRLLSPYQTNPLNLNPVLDILGRQIDFERVRACDRTKLFISATNVRTGKIRIFKTQELTREAVMASAALPQIYQAVEIEVPAYPEEKFHGAITAIEPGIDPNTRSVRIRATLANPERRLRPGMFAEVWTIEPARKEVLSLPETAVTYSPFGDTVFIVVEQDGATIVERRRVRTGEVRDGRVEIVSEILPGDRVVAVGQNKLRNGMPVTITENVSAALASETP